MMCFGFIFFMQCQLPTPMPADSFCLVYQRVVQAKGDGDIKGTSGVKRRILANELTWKKVCQGK